MFGQVDPEAEPFEYDPHLEEFRRQINAYLGIFKQCLPEILALRKEVAELDLRDGFARAALTGFMTRVDGKADLAEVAQHIYKIADAMLEARKLVRP